MELVKSLATSAVRFIAAPSGTDHVFVPDLAHGVQERYRFWEGPKTIEEFNLNTGARFKTGVFGQTKINALTIYSNGISVEGHAHTDALDAVVDDIISWAESTFDVEFVATEPLAKGFTSSVEVLADPVLLKHFVRLAPVMERLTLMVASYGFTLATYQTTGLIAQSEPSMGKPITPGRFIFEHRAGTILDSGVFYSEAPLSTSHHMELLDLLEATLTTA